MSTFFKIRRKSDGLFFRPKWGATGFQKHGKVYAKGSHARVAWKNAHVDVRSEGVELVEFAVVEKGAVSL